MIAIVIVVVTLLIIILLIIIIIIILIIIINFSFWVEPTSKLENISRPVTWSRGY